MRSVGNLWWRLGSALALALVGSGALGFNIFFIIFSWWTIQLSAVLISLLHGTTFLDGNLLYVQGKLIEFIPACIAAGAYLLLALLIVLTRGMTLKKGLYLFFFGSLLILVANVIRIEILVALLLKEGVNYFETLHLLIWKVVSSVYVAAVWIFLCWKFKVREIPVWSDLVALSPSLRKRL